MEQQLNLLINPSPHLTRYSLITSTDDQYFNFNILTSSWGTDAQGKHPYYFLTGPAGTGKSYMLELITTYLNNSHKSYLLMAPTGVAAQNINGKTIHSELQIKPGSNNFISLALEDAENRMRLREIKVLIIDEISMVSSYLLDFINQMFCELHNCALPFGGVMVLLAGDLAQLPPINAPYVFKSVSWKLFMPLFLTIPKRQSEDIEFFEILQQIRFNQITDETWEKLKEKVMTPSNTNFLLETTHVMGYRHMVDMVNETIINYLPIDEQHDLSFTSFAEDKLNKELWGEKKCNKHFRKYTNLPDTIQIKKGARVMFLNNTLFNNGICNGSIGIIMKIHNEESIDVVFPTKAGLSYITVNKTTDRFNYHGQPASRYQFPIQNAFALTVHKTQGLTLPHTTISLDSQMFTTGQAYVAISRAKTWDSLTLTALDRDSIKTDEQVITEYNRLQEKYNRLVSSFGF
jgi:ATP-dependent DNA helicase PIF1